MSSGLDVALARAQREAAEASDAVERARRRAEYYATEALLVEGMELSDDQGTPIKPVSSTPSLLGHLRYPFDQQIPWYPNVREYSRRELLADAIVHGLGLALGAAAFVATIVGAIKQWLQVWRFEASPPLVVAASIAVYGSSLLAMLICSALFNVGQKLWRLHNNTLALLDHIGICLLIAGSATPILVFSCAWRSSAVLWVLMLLTIFAKAAGGFLDNIALHVVAFVLGPFLTYQASIGMVRDTLKAWQLNLIWVAGAFYVGGLLPWGIRQLEFHVAIWHVCVIVGSASVFAVVYVEVDTPEEVRVLEHRLWSSCEG